MLRLKLHKQLIISTNSYQYNHYRSFFGIFNGSYIDKSNGNNEILINSNDNKLTYSINNSFAPLAESSVLTRCGNSVVHVSVCSGKCDEPSPNMVALNVDYRSRAYAFGKLVDSKQKRERHNTDDEVLVGRIIDRSIRPLFPKGYLDEIQLTCTAHSVDGIHDPIVTAVNGASMALMQSKQPWNGPIGCARVGIIDGELILNPSVKDMERSTLDLIYAGTNYRTLMIEISGHEIEETKVKEAMRLAHSAIQEIIELQKQAISKKQELLHVNELPNDVKDLFNKNEFIVKDFSKDMINKIINIPDNLQKIGIDIGYNAALEIFCKGLQRSDRSKCEAIVRSNIMTKLTEKVPDISSIARSMTADYVMKKAFRDTCLLRNTRVDGRDINKLRDINFDSNVLPQLHGSSFFERGETRVLCTSTIGSLFEEKIFFPINGASEKTENFFLHYDFPPYCTGEVGNATSTNRRMIGHGNLAEKALKAVIPPPSDFPYTIRVFSECTSSNGSSSMASACGASLALVDAGVPIKSHVAGLSIGLVTADEIKDISNEEKDINNVIPKSKYLLLTDILGSEDHYGDMDFKIAGTKKGITAVQLDVKLSNGIPISILEEALDHAMEGRKEIIEKMDKYNPFLPQNLILKNNIPRAALIKYEQSRYKYLVGPGGEMIKFIEETYNCNLKFREEGVVYVYGENEEDLYEACLFIKELACNINEGDVFNGQVVEVKDYGVLLKITRAQIALLHISELTHDPELLKKPVSELVAVGQRLMVKVLNVDKGNTNTYTTKNNTNTNTNTKTKGTGQIKVSRKQFLGLQKDEKDPLVLTVPTEDTPQIGSIPSFPTTPPRAWSREYFKSNVATESDIEKVMKVKDVTKATKPRDSSSTKKDTTTYSSSPSLSSIDNNNNNNNSNNDNNNNNNNAIKKDTIDNDIITTDSDSNNNTNSNADTKRAEAKKSWRERGSPSDRHRRTNSQESEGTSSSSSSLDISMDKRERVRRGTGGRKERDRGDRGDRKRGERPSRSRERDTHKLQKDTNTNTNTNTNNKSARPIQVILDELLEMTDNDDNSGQPTNKVVKRNKKANTNNDDDELVGDGYRGLFTHKESK